MDALGMIAREEGDWLEGWVSEKGTALGNKNVCGKGSCGAEILRRNKHAKGEAVVDRVGRLE